MQSVRLDIDVQFGELSPQEQMLLAKLCKRKRELLEEIQKIRTEIIEVTAEIESYDNADQQDKNSKSQFLAIGKKKFNMDPKKCKINEYSRGKREKG